MAPQIEIHYFDIKGRALPSRLAMHHSGVEFKDVRIPMGGSTDYKEAAPCGQLPYMCVDGQKVCQSMAIQMYVANITNLGFKEPLNQSRIIEVIGVIDDIFAKLFSTMGMSEEDKKTKRIDMCKTFMPCMLAKFDKIIAANGKNGFAVTDRLSMADFTIFSFVDFIKCGFLDHVELTIVDQYKNIIGVYEKVKAMPKVQEWYQKHEVKK